MRTLILGGTVFLGRHVANEALSRGHELTLFTRGKHGIVDGGESELDEWRSEHRPRPMSSRREHELIG